MAIYKNREVTVIAPVTASNHPDTVKIQHNDNLQDNVSISQIGFTEVEKKDLMKRYPGMFDNAHLVTDDDVKAVRIGLAPSYDPVLQSQAEEKAKYDHLARMNQEQQKKLADQASKKVSHVGGR